MGEELSEIEIAVACSDRATADAARRLHCTVNQLQRVQSPFERVPTNAQVRLGAAWLGARMLPTCIARTLARRRGVVFIQICKELA